VLQLVNPTPLRAALAILPDRHGVDALIVTAKGTFDIAPAPALSAEQAPCELADVHSGEPGLSSLICAGEMHLPKPGTDVVLVGHAHAPGGRPVESFDVRVRVGPLEKVVRVFGDRAWKAGIWGTSITAPAPFVSMPLVYERAFGGTLPAEAEGGAAAEERNPVGVGFRGGRRPARMDGTPLPNLEDPRALLRKPGDAPAPAGFGCIAPSWLPRRRYAGTYDERWRKERAPYLPADFDPRYFHVAHPDLVHPTALRGDERVEVDNASARGTLRFGLPGLAATGSVRIAGRTADLRFALETVTIEPDRDRFTLVWRASFGCDRSALRIESVRIALGRLAAAARGA
jgi:hypothetical protein